ncbi:MAG: hypothetical protein PWQ17_874 [Anaerophaga sp.]|nr:hypothetical protein [Anaerophaga sp.]
MELACKDLYMFFCDKPCHARFNCSFWHCPKKNQKGLVRLNLSARESQNFRPLRKAVNIAHFGFLPSAGPESGQATAPF